ncbi:MAG: DNA replication/repair protein RecF [Magnetospirillum sp. WYHS-4]
MSLSRLTLTDFRGYRHLRLETDSRPVVVAGANGAGKTNLLEAISYLVPGRGLRGAPLSEVARQGGGPEWAVAASLATSDGPLEVGTGQTGDKRTVRINGETVRNQSTLAEYLSVHWLTPQMDRLFLEGPQARRRFLDRLVFSADPAHAGRVAGYEHAMRERLRLLRDGQGDGAWLSALEDTMAGKGVAVAAARLDMADRLGAFCARQAPGPFPRAALAVEGTVEGWLAAMPALEAEDRLRSALAARRSQDGQDGATGIGPHRSDLAVRHLGKDQAAGLCSTGEQKGLLLALVLANARLQAAERGSLPILLLDEVAAHLDSVRRQALFDELLDLKAQAWMTGTDAALFAPLGARAQFFTVEDAAVTAAH